MNQQTHRKQQADTLSRSAMAGARAPRADHLRGRGLSDPLLSRSAKASADDDKDDDDRGRLHRSARAAGGGGVSGAWGRATAGASGPVPYRREMERAFGQDFSGVRAYMGRREPMEAIGAHAAANGEQIAFAEASPSRKLVAHELTHVVQRRRAGGGGGGVRGSMKLSQPGDATEQEAERVGEAVGNGEKVNMSTQGIRATASELARSSVRTDPFQLNPTAGDIKLRDGIGGELGTVAAGSMVKFNIVGYKTIGSVEHGLGFNVQTKEHKKGRTGWIELGKFRDADAIKSAVQYKTGNENGLYTPTKKKTSPKEWIVTGGSGKIGEYRNLRVKHHGKPPNTANELATDYLKRPGHVVNFCRGLPHHEGDDTNNTGGIALDIIPIKKHSVVFTQLSPQYSVKLYRWKRRSHGKWRTIKEGYNPKTKGLSKHNFKSIPAHKEFPFVFGSIDFGLGNGDVRMGWIAKEALRER